MNIAILAPMVKKIIEEILGRIPDPNERAKAQEELEKIIIQGTQQVNANEANHRSVFVAGWRPFIGWVGGAGLAWVFLLKPAAQYIIVLSGNPVPLPELVPTENLMELVFALLGFGTLRSIEKLKGATK